MMLRSGARYNNGDMDVNDSDVAAMKSAENERGPATSTARVSGGPDGSAAMEKPAPRLRPEDVDLEYMNGDGVVNNPQNNGTGINRDFIKTVLLINACMYSLCYMIQVGVLPYLTQKLGMDMVTFGYLQTWFSFVSLVGGPIYGRYGDVYGGRAALTLAYSSGAIMYGMLSVARTTSLVFISRIPSLFLHSFHGTQMVITDITDEETRTEALGKIGMFYSMGVVVGPLIGGWITVYGSEQTASAVACIGSCVSVALILLLIPRNTKPAQPPHITQAQGAQARGSVFSLKKFVFMVRQSPKAAFFLSVNLLASLPGAIMSSMLALVVMEQFQLNADQNGYLMSFQGVISIVVQGMVIGPLTKACSEITLLKGTAILLASSYFLLSFVHNAWQLAAVLLPITCGNCITFTVINSVLTKAVPSSESGTILGLSHAGNSLVGTVAPILGAWMLTRLGFPSLGVAGAILNVVLCGVLMSY